MKLKELCKKYDLSENAYLHLCNDVSKSKNGIYFTVMRDWKYYDYFICKDGLDVKDVKKV